MRILLLSNELFFLKEMSIGSVVWNLTEYICYLCIIFNTALTALGMIKGVPAGNGDEHAVGLVTSLLNRVVDQFTETNNGNNRAVRRHKKH